MCAPGKYGFTCQQTCGHSNCVCTEQWNCVSCQAGFWNKQNNCLYVCISPACFCLNGNNCETCQEWFYDPGVGLCEGICSAGCNETKCNDDGTCTCKPYYTGNKCDSCVDGRYGSECLARCSKGCLANTCSSFNGTCKCKHNFAGDKCDTCVDGLYGQNCSFTCSSGCLNDTCSSADGKCNCKRNYDGKTCDACVNGWYGKDCMNQCSKNCEDYICEFNTGRCLIGCITGYVGANCTFSTEEHITKKNKSEVEAAVGGLIAAVLVDVAVLSVIIILKRRNQIHLQRTQHTIEESDTPQPVVYASVQENSNSLYEEIVNNAANNERGIAKNDSGHGVYTETQQVELVMEEEIEDDCLE
ncbi:LAMA5-like protein [Mya arenaria]|uniref:LAMA5-like protein n=1 Tax=Mya arenaria TaxID=6604 RepID=A0ABY7F554_MYAAR|nr:LAMA5-like protein [Mya arenaria]